MDSKASNDHATIFHLKNIKTNHKHNIVASCFCLGLKLKVTVTQKEGGGYSYFSIGVGTDFSGNWTYYR